MTERYNIAMVAACPFPYPRGTPVRIFRMAQVLSELGQEVHVITYHLGQKEQASPFAIHRILDLNFYKKNSPGPSYLKLLVVDPILTLKILTLYKKYKFDIIHAHHVEGLLASLPIRLLGDAPIIFDMHTLLATELPYYQIKLLNQSFLKKIGTFLDWCLPKYADHLISVSEEIKDELINAFDIPNEKVSVIPNGIEFEHFTLGGEKHRSNGKSIVLGYAGNFAEYQGVEIMLKALSILSKAYPYIRLNLYSNDTIDKYRPMIARLNITSQVKIFSSDFQDLPNQLAQADILLNPRPEGLGLPLKLLNYLAAGKPIVSFAGTARFLKHGENGWIVANDNAKAFADGIAYIAANEKLAAKLGRNAKVFVEQGFSWQSRGTELIEIYKSIVKTKR